MRSISKVYLRAAVVWLCLSLTLFSSMTLFVSPAYAQTTVSVINPLTGDGNFFFNTSIDSVGDTFMARIVVNGVVGLNLFQIMIGFDSALLNVNSLTYTSDIGDYVFDGLTGIPTTPEIDNSAGYALGGVAVLGTSTFSGDGTLCMIQFQIMDEPPSGGTLGPSPIDVITSGTNDKKPGFYTFLLDVDLFEMAYTDVDGTYKFVSPSGPVPTATVYIAPPRISDPTLTPCNDFTINVSINNAAQLVAFEFTLGFDPAVIKATSVELGDFFPPITPLEEINNETGYVWLSAELPISEPPRNGNGTLAQVTFHVEALGVSSLHLYDVSLTNDLSQPIPYETEDGNFNNVLVAKLYAQPPEVIDPLLVPPATFTINVTLDDVENMYGYEFNMSFDPTILTCTSLNVQEALNESNFDSLFTVNNIKGFIWVRVSYYPPAIPITTYSPVTLVILTFRVKGYGATPLDLHDTSLTDDLGGSIAHEVEDGFFQNFRRNVAVIDIALSHTQVYPGWTVQINVTVKNKGDLNETFDVEAEYNGVLVGTLTATNLTPESEMTLSFNWSTSGLTPCQNYTISAEALAVPFETDLTDNVLVDGQVKVKLLGDVDGDGQVDMADIGFVTRGFGSYPGHPRWNPDADMNQSGFIDMKDIGLAITNYGKTCP